MTKEQREQKAREILDFRYSIIAELLNPYLSRPERRKLIREKAKREYEIPHSNKRSISGDCINKWYRKFKDFGKEALAPKSRSDIGVSRVLASEEAAALTEYLDVNPELTARAAYKKLREEGVITKELSSSSLSRLICAAGLDRESREKRGDERQQLKFAFLHPLECVQADIMHGFPVPDEEGKLKKTYLLVILDDASRMIVYGNFCRRESSIEFEYGIKHVLLSRGRIGRVFCDNGAPFVSGQTLRILSILGIHLIHSRVGYASSRGKVERLFRTIRDQFLRPLDKQSIRSLGDLNARFHMWVESEYHRNAHRGLAQKTPLEVWLEKAHHIIHMDPTIDLDEIFKHEMKRRVYNDCTFTLDGVLYEVPSILKGKNIKIRFNPFLPSRKLDLLYGKRSYGEARVVDTYANTKVKRKDSDRNSVDVERNPKRERRISPAQAAFIASHLELSEGEHHDI